MTEFESTSDDLPALNGQLEAYLDGLMSESERAQFERELERNSHLAAEVALQARIDASLQREFPAVVAPAAHLAAFERHLSTATEGPIPTAVTIRWPWMTGLAAAVAAGIVFMLWFGESRDPREPSFTARPLAQVYKQTVAEGFEAYYECRDDARFADTFERRQGVALHLADLPVGSAMKGLSYLGGLSRETTAMLCNVEGHPVMVFVDRDEKDQPLAAEESDPALKVFREERDGLVFYEVTPLDEPTMTQYMVAE